MDIAHVLLYVVLGNELKEIPHKFDTVAECTATLEAMVQMQVRDSHVFPLDPPKTMAYCIPIMDE